jgi:hypothetical protein
MKLDFWATWGFREADRRGFTTKPAAERFAQRQAKALQRPVNLFDTTKEPPTKIGNYPASTGGHKC